ncbi:MAG: hypothetical protein IJD21_07210 [Oscillospiraceae bacterium]|nr:hypothetical protein [Oscillospiraceae bacterium]
MKRILSLLLALCLALACSGCGLRSPEERQLMRSQLDYAKEAPSIDSFNYALNDGSRLEPFQLYTADQVTVTLLGVHETPDDYRVALRLENNSQDWYSFHCGSCTIDRWSVMGSLYEQVCPGGVVDADVVLYKSDYPQAAGPVCRMDLELSCATTGDDGYHEFEASLELRDPAQAQEPELLPLLEDPGYLISLLDTRETDYGLVIDLAVENTGDRYLSLYADESSPVINGQQTYLTLWSSVWLDPGSRSVMSLEMDWMELAELDIHGLKELESFSLELSLDRSGVSEHITLELDKEELAPPAL